MDNNTFIGEWSLGVWTDLGSPSNVTATTISGYAIQPSTLGRLNSLAGTCFSGSGYTGGASSNFQIGPFVDQEVLGIIGQLYLVSYYNNLAQATMGVGNSTIPWTNLREGDSSIARVNAATIGAQYRQMSKDAYTELWNLVNAFRGSQGGSIARSVDFPNPPIGPYWGGNGGQSFTGPR